MSRGETDVDVVLELLGVRRLVCRANRFIGLIDIRSGRGSARSAKLLGDPFHVPCVRVDPFVAFENASSTAAMVPGMWASVRFELDANPFKPTGQVSA